MARVVANGTARRERRIQLARVRIAVVVLAAATALVGGAAAAARTPSPSQKAAIAAALHREQGNVAIQRITISSADPGYASLNWGFSNRGRTAQHSSLAALAGGKWKLIWTRDVEQPADGACIYVPAPVARDLLHVSCPSSASLRARGATRAERGLLEVAFLKSSLTPYAASATGFDHVCVSKLSKAWAGAVAHFPSGGTVIVWFEHARAWRVTYESLIRWGKEPPAPIVLSLASCVGYNPAEFGG